MRTRPVRLALALLLAFGTGSCARPEEPAAAASEPARSGPLPAPAPPERVRGKQVLAEVTSPFSTIRVKQQGAQRSLVFVRPRGDESVQTIVDLERPDAPVRGYPQAMAAALLAVEDPRRLLMIGLGGGSIVRALHARLPEARIDAVEIDPEVVRLAAEWFGVVPDARLRIVTDDAARFIAGEGDAYDIVWLDAYFEPGGPDTDNAGVPEALRGPEFLGRLRARVRPGGVAAFNIHYVSGYREHVDAIAAVFPRVYVARSPDTRQLVVLAVAGDAALDAGALRARAAALDASGGWESSFTALADAITPWQPAAP